ncbi:lytic transglycosylase domain-containing protein [Paraburkholderia sp. Tr-20389]|uniref:lytic transglycosylase domain-containing protein n=1 Tax=Paraburkholderia sp. Tr-20389 TaxID=2703903 RepID=UPI0019814466|nr:lytic transglycosylase domain-containing protein [Paraburkholderia sp. Tr-20389]MBN3753602.1 lytic transglycosylase domain-containing protein [Paraburkholderia sp. Tr-20389]
MNGAARKHLAMCALARVVCVLTCEATLLAVFVERNAVAQTNAPRAGFTQLARSCAANVDVVTLAALVRTESGFNPFAIGVVGGHLDRQPASLAEALATVRALEARGFSYSIGLAQVNNRNFAKYGETAASLFEPCRNLRAAAAILTDCFARSSAARGDPQSALRAALSCYYSGNFTTGFRAGYVGKVVMNARINAIRGSVEAIPVVTDAHAPPLSSQATLDAKVDETLNEAGRKRGNASPGEPVPQGSDDARPALAPVNAIGTTRSKTPSCSPHPLVAMCRGLSAAQIHALCLRCLDAR